MKMNPNSPKYQASIRRWNTYQARKRLERKVQTCFAPDSRFYTLPLDLHRFKLTPDMPRRCRCAMSMHLTCTLMTHLCSICSQTRRTPPYKPRLRTSGYMAITAV